MPRHQHKTRFLCNLLMRDPHLVDQVLEGVLRGFNICNASNTCNDNVPLDLHVMYQKQTQMLSLNKPHNNNKQE